MINDFKSCGCPLQILDSLPISTPHVTPYHVRTGLYISCYCHMNIEDMVSKIRCVYSCGALDDDGCCLGRWNTVLRDDSFKP